MPTSYINGCRAVQTNKYFLFFAQEYVNWVFTVLSSDVVGL